MLKVGSKRRRTKAEIDEEKENEVIKQQKLESDMRELSNLRNRVQEAEERAENNAGAAQLMSHLINAEVVKQDGQQSIIVNAVGGVQRFDVEGGQQQIVVDFEEDDALPNQVDPDDD